MSEKELNEVMDLSNKVQLGICRLILLKGLSEYSNTCIQIKSNLDELFDIIYEAKFKEEHQ